MLEWHERAERGAPERAEGGNVPPAMVREALARIVASSAFDAPERNRRFLEYIVNETLAGHDDRIKAYAVAIAVFGRDDSFDPQTDPIVRIEASRLRRSLERYYLLDGARDTVRIGIPKGGYVPSFARHPAAATPDAAIAEPARRPSWPAKPPALAVAGALALAAALLVWIIVGTSARQPADPPSNAIAVLHEPRILVEPFADDDGWTSGNQLARGFTRELVNGLTRFTDLLVFDGATGPSSAPTAGAVEAGVEFVLKGGVSAADDQLRVSASLVDGQSGRYLWSGRFERQLEAGDLVAARDELADHIVRELAQPYGVLFSIQVLTIEAKPPETLNPYECVLLHQRYWRQPTAAAYPAVRECLERAIQVDPYHADAFASLAELYVDNYRVGFGEPIANPLQQALALATRATELAPASAQAQKALYLVLWLTNDVQHSLRAAERALDLNPQDTVMMAELGLRYAIRNDIDRGVTLIERAQARNPNLPGIYQIGPFLQHYRDGRYAEALAAARRIRTPDVFYGHIALAMANARLGRTADATAALERLASLDPAYGDHVIADLEKRNVHPELIHLVVDGLRSAGLEVTDEHQLKAH